MNKAGYKYRFQTRPEMLEFVPDSCSRILEVGCGDGAFSTQLKQLRPNIEVWGVELNSDVAEIAAGRLNRVMSGDFAAILAEKQLPLDYFDCMIFNDVLEHFVNPEEILNSIKPFLKSDGFVVSSLPNFRYVGNLWEIVLEGDFRYKDAGILDRTHYRFFTIKSIKRLFDSTGFQILKIEGVNPTNSLKVRLFKALSFNKFNDIPFMQIASLARVNKQ